MQPDSSLLLRNYKSRKGGCEGQALLAKVRPVSGPLYDFQIPLKSNQTKRCPPQMNANTRDFEAELEAQQLEEEAPAVSAEAEALTARAL